jgi:transketolase
MRNAFAQEIAKLGNKNKKIILLSGDIGNRLFDNFRKLNKNRFYNCGIAEACMTGIASGMATTGLLPVTYTITPFNTMRCLEQIKLDICYPNLPIIIVGTGAGLSYASLGSTHHSLEDISILRSIPNMSILCPSDPSEVKSLLKEAIKFKSPVYLRLGKKNEPKYLNRKKIGTMHELIKGKDNCLVNVGSILKNVMEASKILSKNKINHSVYDLRIVRPINKKSLEHLLKNYKKVFVVEEHYENGGAYSCILELANKYKKLNTRIYSIGVENKFIKFCGNQESAREITGLDPHSIFKRVKKEI